MATNNPYELPTISTAPDYNSIIGMLKSVQGMPTLQSMYEPLVGQNAQYLQPQVQAIQQQTQQNVAAAQSDAMKRGLTGSSIEGMNMNQARTQGLQTESQMRSQFALSMSELIAKAMAGDLEAAQQLRYNLAQAMGQELGSQREMQMFQQQISAMNDQAAKNRKNALWGAGIGAGAQIGSALINAFAQRGGGASPSDSRLKKNVRHIKTIEGVSIVEFEWNETAVKMGLPEGTKHYGVIAQQVQEVMKDVVGESSGYLFVNYDKLPKKIRSEIARIGGE